MSELIYKGKITFSDMVPGLRDAAATLREKNAEVGKFLDDRQKNVAGLQKRTEALQDEMRRAQEAASKAQDILSDAQGILDEAKGLVNQVASALDASGIYLYQYVGTIGEMGNFIASATGAGLPDKLPGQPHAMPNPHLETVAANLIIVGGDGGTVQTVSRIQSLFGQIGGNANEIVNLYRRETDD